MRIILAPSLCALSSTKKSWEIIQFYSFRSNSYQYIIITAASIYFRSPIIFFNIKDLSASSSRVLIARQKRSKEAKKERNICKERFKIGAYRYNYSIECIKTEGQSSCNLSCVFIFRFLEDDLQSLVSIFRSVADRNVFWTFEQLETKHMLCINKNIYLYHERRIFSHMHRSNKSREFW